MPPKSAPAGPDVLVMKKVMLGNCGGGCCAMAPPANAPVANANTAKPFVQAIVRMLSSRCLSLSPVWRRRENNPKSTFRGIEGRHRRLEARQVVARMRLVVDTRGLEMAIRHHRPQRFAQGARHLHGRES